MSFLMLNSKPRVLCVICARGGSKGLKKKNLRTLGGETLIARAIRHAIESACIDEIIFSTDDVEMSVEAKKAGAHVPFLRPVELAHDLTTTEDVLKHALLTYESNKNTKFDTCVFVTTTDIIRDPAWISAAVERLHANTDLESVFSGSKTHKNYWELDESGSWSRVKSWMSTYSSRQIRKFIVREDTGMACASRAWLWRDGRRIGDKVDIIVNNDSFTSIDIHTEEDLLLAQAAINIREKH